jgi:hypothetical protein
LANSWNPWTLNGALSQIPYFDPADEAIPSFAGQWFDRFERGDDSAHWYGSQAAV